MNREQKTCKRCLYEKYDIKKGPCKECGRKYEDKYVLGSKRQRDKDALEDMLLRYAINGYPMNEITTSKSENLAGYLVDNGVSFNRWIPVTDAVPEENEQVLALCKNHLGAVGFFRCCFHEGTIKIIRTEMDVIAWMPMPDYDDLISEEEENR